MLNHRLLREDVRYSCGADAKLRSAPILVFGAAPGPEIGPGRARAGHMWRQGAGATSAEAAGKQKGSGRDQKFVIRA